MKTTKKIFLLLAAISIVTAGAFAQQKAATTSMQFLKVMPCARATAMGDAYSAVATGAEAVYWNPAGLAWSNNQEISLTYINWIFDAKLYSLAYGLPLGDYGNLGLQLQYVDYGNFDETVAYSQASDVSSDYPYYTGKTFKPYDYEVGISYAKKITEKFSFGLTGKYAYESLYGGNATARVTNSTTGLADTTYTVDANRGVFLFDAGFLYNTGFKTIRIAASVQNFGPDIEYKSSYIDTKYPAPLEFRLGTSADLIGKNSLFMEDNDNRVGVAFDLFLANDADQQEHLGLEYEFANTFALRVGYKVNYSTEGFTFGGGVHQTLGNLRLTVDYSYGAMDAMISDYTGNVHRISVGVGIQ
jgi:hypothetical protein